MEVTLDDEESTYIQSALRSYCSDLRMEIADTDNPEFRRGLKHEREVLERALTKLDAALEGAADQSTEQAVRVTFVGFWSR